MYKVIASSSNDFTTTSNEGTRTNNNSFKNQEYLEKWNNEGPTAPLGSGEDFSDLLLSKIPNTNLHKTTSFSLTDKNTTRKVREENGNIFVRALQNPKSNFLDRKRSNINGEKNDQEAQSQTSKASQPSADTAASRFAAEVRSSILLNPSASPTARQRSTFASPLSKPTNPTPGSTPIKVNQSSAQTEELEESIRLINAWMEAERRKLEPQTSSMQDKNLKKVGKTNITDQIATTSRSSSILTEGFSYRATSPSNNPYVLPNESKLNQKDSMLGKFKNLFRKNGHAETVNSNGESSHARVANGNAENVRPRSKRSNTNKTTKTNRSTRSFGSIKSIKSFVRRFGKHQSAVA